MKSRKIFGVIFVALFAFIGFKSNVSAWNIDMEDVAETKKITIPAVEPTTEDLWGIIDETLYFSTNGWVLDECNEDFSVCSFSNWEIGKIEDVEVTWEYDEAVKTVVDGIMSRIPEDGITFTLNDVETIRFIVAKNIFMDEHGEYIETMDDLLNLATYSSELREFLGYNNFKIEPRLGDGNDFFEMQGGTATFIYDDTVYAVSTGISVQLQYVFYVPKDTEDVEAYFKEKMAKYFDEELGSDGGYELDIDELLATEEATFGNYYDDGYEYLKNNYPTKNDYVSHWMNHYYLDETAPCHFLLNGDTHFEEFYVGDVSFDMLIVEDDEKAALSSDGVITKDAKWDIIISTNSIIPLDTLIEVARITSGEEYDRIVSILEETDIDVFDLNLFSKTVGDYITELEDGTFEVRLPIKEEMQGKALMVYYINEDGEKTAYDIEYSEDGKYAIFYTNHFSTYTLAVDPNGNTNNPLTYDNVTKYIFMVIACMMGLGTIAVIKKRFN